MRAALPRLHRRAFLSLATGALAGAALPGRAAAAAERKLGYTVFRDGKDIGRHEMTLAEADGLLSVTSRTDIAVRAAIFTLYKFEQSTTESWRAGRLVAFTATTDDDGTPWQVEAKPAADGLALTVNGKTSMVDAGLAPASLGNPRLVQLSKLFDTADGSQLSVRTRLVSEEQVTVRGAKLRAKRYSFTGDMRRDIWYDASGTPVQVAFDGKDGSRIRFVQA